MTQNLAERELGSGHRRKNNNNSNKPRVDYEPRSAHGRVVNKLCQNNNI